VLAVGYDHATDEQIADVMLLPMRKIASRMSSTASYKSSTSR
jgi:hypothetical protein